MKKGVVLASKFVCKAVEERRAGNLGKYKMLIAEIKSGRNIGKWLKAFSCSINRLNPELIFSIVHMSLINADLPLSAAKEMEKDTPWIDREVAERDLSNFSVLLDDYSDFIVNLVSMNSGRFDATILDHLLGKRFFSSPSPSYFNEDGEAWVDFDCVQFPATNDNLMTWRWSLVMDRVHELIAKIIEISPAYLKSISERLRSNAPTIYSGNMEQVNNFVSNSLYLSDVVPTLRSSIMELLLELIVKLDIHCDTSINEADTASDYSGEEDGGNTSDEGNDDEFFSADGHISDDCDSQAASESPQDEMLVEVEEPGAALTDPKVLILNSIIGLLTNHMKSHGYTQEMFSLIINNEHLLKGNHLRYASAILFHAISVNPDHFEWLISYLVISILDGQRNNVIRLNCCCFLTILARFKLPKPSAVHEFESDLEEPDYSTPPPSPVQEVKRFDRNIFEVDGTIDTVSQTLLLLSQYLHCSLDLQSIGPTFYHIVNTIMYIFSFRFRELLMLNQFGEPTTPVITNSRMLWWNTRGGFSRILLSKYAILQQCTPEIVKEFLNVCQSQSLFYYSNSKSDSKELSVSVRKSSRSSNLMDLYYFPFDSHMLDLDIGQELKPYFREWIDID